MATPSSTIATIPKKMKAVFWDGKPFHVEVRNVATPAIQQGDDAIVRLTTAAICGSDLHTYHGILGSPKIPYSLGHEGVGVVVAVGPGTTTVTVGDRVIVPDVPSQGHFNPHRSLDATQEASLFGEGTLFGNLGGCQAEYVRVPFADQSLTILPAGSPAKDLDLVLLSDILCTAWGGLNFTGFQPGDTVVVFGAGPVGLLTAYSALFRGASKVYSVDHVKARLAKAASIGAIPIDLESKDSPSAQILALEPEGVQRVADAVGEECVNAQLKPQENYVLQEAIRMVSVNGGIGVIGVYFAGGAANPGQPRATSIPGDISLSFSQVWSKNVTIRGGLVPTLEVVPTLLPLVVSGRLKPSFVFSSEISIDEVPKGYERFNRHLETKVAIRFDHEADQ